VIRVLCLCVCVFGEKTEVSDFIPLALPSILYKKKSKLTNSVHTSLLDKKKKTEPVDFDFDCLTLRANMTPVISWAV